MFLGRKEQGRSSFNSKTHSHAKKLRPRPDLSSRPRTSGGRVQISDEVVVLLIVDFVVFSSNCYWLPVENNNGMMDGGRDTPNPSIFSHPLLCDQGFLFVEWDVLKVMKEKEKEKKKGIDRQRREIGKGREVVCLMIFFFWFFLFLFSFINPMKMMKNTKKEAKFPGYFCHVSFY